MKIVEAVETPQSFLATSKAVSPFGISPIPNTKKRTGNRGHKATSSWLVGWL